MLMLGSPGRRIGIARLLKGGREKDGAEGAGIFVLDLVEILMDP